MPAKEISRKHFTSELLLSLLIVCYEISFGLAVLICYVSIRWRANGVQTEQDPIDHVVYRFYSSSLFSALYRSVKNHDMNHSDNYAPSSLKQTIFEVSS